MGGVIKACIGEVNLGVEWRGCGRRFIGQGSEEGEEIFVDIDAQCADREDVTSQMEFAVLTRWQEKRGVDVRLDDEVAKLRRDHAFGGGSRGWGWRFLRTG